MNLRGKSLTMHLRQHWNLRPGFPSRPAVGAVGVGGVLGVALLVLLVAWPAAGERPPAPQDSGRPAAETSRAPDCHYHTWVWDTRARRSVGHRRVATRKSQLGPEALHAATGCTVCREDQAWITLEGLPPFAVCRSLAADVRRALRQAVEAGFPILEVSAYRVGMSKGPVDANGLRTQFSNHSFGIALDVNASRNGLYTRCTVFGPRCTLLRGGPWRPGVPGTVTQDSAIYRAFRDIGWKWGGELPGRQKDFMHFSLSGD